MKQNVKFIWIYGLILFSFALILIVFAGFTQKENQTVSNSLTNSLTSLTQERNKYMEQCNQLADDNKKLLAQNTGLQSQLDSLTQEKNNIYAEKEAAIIAYGGDAEVTRTLLKAYHEKASGNLQLAKTTIENLDVSSMSSAQKYIYDSIMGE